MYLEVESKSYGDNIPWTPLMLAAALGRKEIIDFLLTYKGIDISIKDSTGRTALEISRDGIHCDRKVYPECLKKFQEENSIVVQQQQPQQKNDEPSAKQTAAVIVSLSEQLKVAQEQIEKQQSENATLTKSLSEAKEHIEKQQSENATLTQSLSEAKGQNQSIQEEFDHFKKLAGDFRGFLALITKDISERVEKESQTQTTLLERQKTLETILQQLYTEKDQIEKGMQLIKINDEKLSGWLDANSKVDVEKDLLLGVLDDLALQVLELQAEDRAIEDLFYYLDKQIQEGGIDVDVFLATIRELAKRQFMAKTLLKEIQNI
jgi:chromosome segregation ATPase